MKLREWVRRNWGWLILVGAVCWTLYWILDSVPLPTAHAQKPAEQLTYGPVVYFGDTHCMTLPSPEHCQMQLLRVWIEQHCVAVMDSDYKPSCNGRYDIGCAHPEQTLKLRCTPDKEQK